MNNYNIFQDPKLATYTVGSQLSNSKTLVLLCYSLE